MAKHYTQQAAAEFLACSIRTLRRYDLPTIKHGKNKMYAKADLLKIASKVQDKQEKHRPDPNNLDIPRIEVVTSKDQVAKAIKADTTQDLLNATGDMIMLRTTAYLKEKGLFETCSHDAIYGYSVACQMKEKYMIVADMMEEKMYHDLAKMYQTEIQYYQKELGLTPASLAKIKPQEKDDKVTIDPMEALLNS